LFELITKELKSIGRAAKLPGGIVLSGGSVQMHGMTEYAKEALQLSARIGKSDEFSGVADKAKNPAWNTALGLMLIDLEGGSHPDHTNKKSKDSKSSSLNVGAIGKALSGVIGKFRS